ncbi:MAG: ATPase V [Miniphocaeibacter sp.]|uniref:hypothetical protein n=1 Tax=Miniphocaeibacter sp. TaxID=3100973 RepID=UPI00180ABAD3|nr:ATPase V [Gallicola sp.]
MSSNAINKIKDAEIKAETLVNDAKDKSFEIQEQMKVQGKEKYDEIVKEAELERQKILELAKKKSKEIEAPILKNAENESQKILNTNGDDLNSIADSIVERIVKNYGNS